MPGSGVHKCRLNQVRKDGIEVDRTVVASRIRAERRDERARVGAVRYMLTPAGMSGASQIYGYRNRAADPFVLDVEQIIPRPSSAAIALRGFNRGRTIGNGTTMLGRGAEGALAAVGLIPVMEMTAGAREIRAALIDGPVAAGHPDLATENIRSLSAATGATTSGNGVAVAHGTYVAGILAARRGSEAPAICPGCTLLVRPIFLQTASDIAEMPSATPDEVADAVAECVDAGARVVNLSVAVASPSPNKEKNLEEALSYAAHRGAIVVAAAGNQGTIGSSAITRHVWVIPVAACDVRGQPIGASNLGASIGRRGLMAPGEAVTSLGTRGEPVTSGGTSAAAPFVTGSVALLWSAFPTATATEIKRAITQAGPAARKTIVPPLLNAWAAYQTMASSHSRRTTA